MILVIHGYKVRPPTPPENGDPVNDVADRLDNLDTTADKEGAFDAIASQHQGRISLLPNLFTCSDSRSFKL